MSISSNFQKSQVKEVLQSQIIPGVLRGAPWVMLDPVPFVMTRGQRDIVIREEPAPALPALHGKGEDVRLRRWDENNLNAYNIPYWGYVAEGEADLVVGITEKMSELRGIAPKRWVISTPKGTLFWAPPGVPLSMGGNNGIHWQRPHPEKAYSRIFWMHVTPTGASCHFCTTEKGRHWDHPHLFIATRDVWHIAQRITNGLKSTFAQRQALVEHLMGTLLLYTLEGMGNHAEMPLLVDATEPAKQHIDHEEIIQDALSYIDEHFHESKLTIGRIADHVHLSSTHLNRLFRKHLKWSIKEVILNTRFERARGLLENSNFNVGQIATFCGYCHPSSFIAAFEKRHEESPLAYRQKRTQRQNGPIH